MPPSPFTDEETEAKGSNAILCTAQPFIAELCWKPGFSDPDDQNYRQGAKPDEVQPFSTVNPMAP